MNLGNLLLPRFGFFEDEVDFGIACFALGKTSQDAKFKADFARDLCFRLNRAQAFFLKINGEIL
jgi:hypothetical protein